MCIVSVWVADEVPFSVVSSENAFYRSFEVDIYRFKVRIS